MPNTVAQMYDVISVCLVSSDQPLHSVSHLLLWGGSKGSNQMLHLILGLVANVL